VIVILTCGSETSKETDTEQWRSYVISEVAKEWKNWNQTSKYSETHIHWGRKKKRKEKKKKKKTL